MKNSNRKFAALALMASAALTLGGCASGPYNGLGKDPMAKIFVYGNPYIHDGRVSGEAMGVVATTAAYCQMKALEQSSGVISTAAAYGAGSAIFGAAGLGGGVSFLPGSHSFSGYGPYGGVTSGAAGVNGGIVYYSSDMAGKVGGCTHDNVEEDHHIESLKEAMEGVHATTSLTPAVHHNRHK